MDIFLTKTLRADIFVNRDRSEFTKLYFKHVPASKVAYEFKATTFAYSRGIPAARALKEIQKAGRFGIVLNYEQGYNLADFLRANPLLIFKYAKKTAQLHLQIHTQKAKPLIAQEYSLSNSLDYALRNYPNLNINKQQLLNSLIGEVARLCHCDFSPDNILVNVRSKKIIAIDWADASNGNPLYDVARTILLIQSPTSYKNKSILKQWIGKYGALLFTFFYLTHYKKHSNLSFKNFRSIQLLTHVIRLNSNIVYEEDWLLKRIKKMTI